MHRSLYLAALRRMLCLLAWTGTARAQSWAALDAAIEAPAGVKVLAANGFAADDMENESLAGGDDAVTAWVSWETAALTLEVQGPKRLRLYHWIGGANTGGFTWLRVDGVNVQEYNYTQESFSDVEVPPGTHHLDLITYATPVALLRVVELVPGAPALKPESLQVPPGAPFKARLHAASDSPVTWSAVALPEGLTLDATGLLQGTVTFPETYSPSRAAWVEMSNAHGSQVAQLVLRTLTGGTGVSPSLPLTAAGGGAPYYEPPYGPIQAGPVPLSGVTVFSRTGTASATVPRRELAGIVQGPETVWFRATGSRWRPDATVVRVDGAEVLREFCLTAGMQDFSVSIPAGEHEIAWELPESGMLGGVWLESSSAPHLRGPYVRKSLPGQPFAHALNAGAGPVTFTALNLPGGVTLDASTGVIAGTLNAGTYEFIAEAERGLTKDRAVFRLEVREDASAALGTPGWVWFQSSAAQRHWRIVVPAPPGAPVWYTESTGAYGDEQARMECYVVGPVDIRSRVSMWGNAAYEIIVDDTVQSGVTWTNPGQTASLRAMIPPGRHRLALVSKITGYYTNHGGLSLLPLELTPAGSPFISAPPIIISDETGARIPFSVDGEAADSVTATGLPPGMSLDGMEISGALTDAGPYWTSSLTAQPGALTHSADISWRRLPLNEALDSSGWHGFMHSPNPEVAGETQVSWDGISSLRLRVPSAGSETAGAARHLTGPDVLRFKVSAKAAVRMEVKVDGAIVQSALLESDPWHDVAVPIPAGEHFVTIAARSEHIVSFFPDPELNVATWPVLYLDHLRMDGDLRPSIQARPMQLLARRDAPFSWTPQATGAITHWTVTGLPAGFTADTLTGSVTGNAGTLPVGEHSVIFTAHNTHGSDDMGTVLRILEPAQHGDSPRLALMTNDWMSLPAENETQAVDGADIHYTNSAVYTTMSADIEGPDTLRFWRRFEEGSAGSLYLALDGNTIQYHTISDDTIPGWQPMTIPIPAGIHRFKWLGYGIVMVDHLTLDSDGWPLVQGDPVRTVDGAGFTLPFAATGNPTAWTASAFSMSSTGVLSGVPDEDEQEVRITASNAAGTGYTLVKLQRRGGIHDALDSPLAWSVSGARWPVEVPPPGTRPAPVDGPDQLHLTDYQDLRLVAPRGGGLLSLWVRGDSNWVFNSGGQAQSVYFDFPGFDPAEWRRILVPLMADGEFFSVMPQGGTEHVRLDHAEFFRPGDPIVDVCDLPPVPHGTAYTAQLRMLTGSAISWNVEGLPPGLALDSATGLISGTVFHFSADRVRHPLRVRAQTSAGHELLVQLILPFSATEAVGLMVTSHHDAGPGSLREMLATAATMPGTQRIVFAPDAGTITLLSPLTVSSQGVVVDASAPTQGLTLHAGGAADFYLLRLENGAQAWLQRVHLHGGGAGSSEGAGGGVFVSESSIARFSDVTLSGNRSQLGGAVTARGPVLLERCTLRENLGQYGGAVHLSTEAWLSATDCTFDANTASASGGAIWSVGQSAYFLRCTLSGNHAAERGGGYATHFTGDYTSATCSFIRCTLSGNTAGLTGGAISTDMGLNLTHCTVSGNHAPDGGGLALPGSPRWPSVNLEYTILAANTSTALWPDIFQANGSLYRPRPNLIGINTGTGIPAGFLTGTAEAPLDPMLAPLGDYGGLTQTMALRRGSRATQAAAGSNSLTDQRGQPAIGDPDLGAYESWHNDHYAAWMAEHLPASAVNGPGTAVHEDFDQDGQSNDDEWLTDTNPASGAVRFDLTSIREGNVVRMQFLSATGRTCDLQSSSDLASWVVEESVPGDGDTMELVVFSNTRQRYYRIVPGR